MKSADIRSAFLSFFKDKQHQVVNSSSLVPDDDPTLLFTNAGMNQFKDVFLGAEKRSYIRACSSQKCVRAGGKHNDLDNVGYTARHHTFFEMLGNFSFGDYFKRDAINYAWTFLTETLGLPKERLWVTVHVSDDEAANIWINEIGIDPNCLSRLDEDNFWQMGDTGPCGPCSEIFYDHGENVPGGPPGSENDDLDRYIEIWNLVFMQYERQNDGSLKPLPKPSVDTGMGLERIAAVLQNVHSNYEIDIFQALLKEAAEKTNTTDLENKSLRVIADHIRSCSFLISDGVVPSNEGRGYVLRRIIRRAIRHGNKLGQTDVFFYKLVHALVIQMGEAYPDLAKNQLHVEKVLLAEEEQFAKTLDKGLTVLEKKLIGLETNIIPGDVLFNLYDTYGFPADLTGDIARERNLDIDMNAYLKLMDEQKIRARSSGSFEVDYTKQITVDEKTTFLGYETLANETQILHLFKEGSGTDFIREGDQAAIVLSQTPFYGESGGQVGDCGFIEFAGNKFEVRDCQKSGDAHIHTGVVLSGEFSKDDFVSASVNENVRAKIKANHSATHLLHAALRKVLGDHVTQKGSLVNSERLRFDFSHAEAVTHQELKDISRLVNNQIRLNSKVQTELCDMNAAKEKGAMALFGEKYGHQVRVLSMGGNFSVELCGGTHVERTGDIGLLHILSESGIAAGIRRIEAATGENALDEIDSQLELVSDIALVVKTNPSQLGDKISSLVNQNKTLEKDLASLKSKLASASASDWLNEAREFSGVKVLSKIVEGADAKSLRDIMDRLKNKLGRSAVVLAGVNNGKISLVAGVSSDATDVVKAGDIVKNVAGMIDGKGGGRPDMAQGGGTNIKALPKAMDSVYSYINEVKV